eukprot:s880_g30.t1
MPLGTTALDLVQGITEYSSRIALKMLFTQFGEVTACWIPPLEHRSNERAYVKFGTTKAAQAAFEASQAGQLFLDGVALRAEWRMAPARTQDSRDFEARGSNLMTSRDLMRAQMRGGGGDDRKGAGKGRRDLDGGGSRALMMDRVGGSRRNDDRERDREKDKKAKERERSRDRDRKRKSRSRSRDKKKRRERSRSKKRSEERPALQDGAVAIEDDETTTAVI